MSPRGRARSLLVLLTLAAGCPDGCDEEGEGAYASLSGRWRFTTAGLQFDPCRYPGQSGTPDGEAILAGTRWCPGIDTDSNHFECFTASVLEGPATTDGACLELTGDGDVVWRFDPRPCDSDEILLPEHLRVHASTAAHIHGRLVSYMDAMSRDGLVPPTGAFPAELEQPPDAKVLKVAADQPVHVAIDLRAGDRRVAWLEADAAIEVLTLRGAPPEVELNERSTVFLRVPAGTEAALTLAAGSERVPLGRVVGVPAQALADLEVVVAYSPPSRNYSSMPIGARAVVRDEQGDLVYGAHAEWEVLDGSFPLTRFPFIREGVNLDYTLLIEPFGDYSPWCFADPRIGGYDYKGRIAARVGDLRGEAEFAWSVVVKIETVEDVLAERAAPNPHCQGPGFSDGALDCECDARSRGGGEALLMLLLLALGTGRRRAAAT